MNAAARKSRVYISGPMTGMPEDNFPAFHSAAQEWRDDGWDVSNPAENFGGRRDLPIESYLRADVAQLSQCDAIAMLPGWQNSRGARLEYIVARELHLGIFDATTHCPMRDAPDTELVIHSPTTDDSGLKDSGTRRQFATGAVRDGATNKGRFDLLPYFGLESVAKHFEAGALKYDARNWERGIPLWIYLDSAMRHTAKAASGWTDEPHVEAGCWNLLCYLHTRRMIDLGHLPTELADGLAQPFDPRPRGAQ